MRIVSVLPSATEIVCALGARRELVGRSQECDYPETVLDLPVVMRARTLDGDRPSGEIDRRVRASLTRGESLYELDLELLGRLRPNLLFTQDLCGVCSVTDAEVRAACSSAGIAPSIVSLTPRTLEEVWGSIEQVGSALGRSDTARELADELRGRTVPERSGSGARIAVVEWLDPPILAGLWTPDMIRAAGGVALGPEPGRPGRRTTWTELAREGPDLVVLSPCSFSLARTELELRRARSTARAISELGPTTATFLADEAYFSRPGPRLAHGVELLRSLQHGAPGPFPMPVRRFVPRAGEVAA